MFTLIFCSFDAYPSVTETALANMTSMECGLPTLLSFTARELADGTLFKAIEDYDPDSKRILHQLKKYVPSFVIRNITHRSSLAGSLYFKFFTSLY